MYFATIGLNLYPNISYVNLPKKYPIIQNIAITGTTIKDVITFSLVVRLAPFMICCVLGLPAHTNDIEHKNAIACLFMNILINNITFLLNATQTLDEVQSPFRLCL